MHFWNLQANEEELFNLFSPIGDILDLKIVRSTSGKSRGCAFVTYANDKHAQQAITELNGKQVLPATTRADLKQSALHCTEVASNMLSIHAR